MTSKKARIIGSSALASMLDGLADSLERWSMAPQAPQQDRAVGDP